MGASTQKTLLEAEKLAPTAIIIMFVIDASGIGGGTFRYHNGTQLGTDIIWQGNIYTKYPVKVSGFMMAIKGELPRPKVQFSNIFGTFTALNKNFQDLVKAKLIRKRVFYRHLDGQPDADSNAGFPDEVFYFNRKTQETKLSVEYEVVSALEVDGAQLPKRQVYSNLCFWKYRSVECGYTGPPVAKRDGTLITTAVTDRGEWNSATLYNIGDYVFRYIDGTRKQVYVATANGVTGQDSEPPNDSFWITDECSKRIEDGCEPRFGKGSPGQKSDGSLPFGGFPGTRLISGNIQG